MDPETIKIQPCLIHLKEKWAGERLRSNGSKILQIAKSLSAKGETGLLKKAYELSVLCDAEVALVVFSSRGRLYEYANNSVRGTIERYKKVISSLSNQGSILEANAQFYQQEATKLWTLIKNMQNSNKKMVGETLSTLDLKHLKKLENNLEKGLSRIRAKKNELLFAEIEYMRQREIELHNKNQLLGAKIAENERNQQSMNMIGGGSFELMQSHQFDPRNYFQVNELQSAVDKYPRQDHMPLQLV